jgi:hypothetical protein
MERLRAIVPFTSAHRAVAPVAAIIEGYGSVFNTLIDAYVPTIIEPGAFTKTIREQFDRIKILWQHQTDEPIGRPLELREDERGLYVRAQLSATSRGDEAARLLRDGVLNELSIGFDVLRFYMDTSGHEPVRHITELRLWEISLVTFAANPKAKVTQVHRRTVNHDEEVAALERMLAALDFRADERRLSTSALDRELAELMAMLRSWR